MPTETTYSLIDLARLADVTPRTIRYYIGQGLLPSPGAGPNARYGEPHLARLRLIRRLQREHLPLAEIRRRLEDISDDDLVAMAEADGSGSATAAPADSAADYIRRLTSAPTPLGLARPLRVPPPLPATQAAPAAPSAPSAPSPVSTEPERSTWERHVLAPDVELHVRRPLDRHSSKQVDRLIRIARELLADDQ